MYTRDRKPRKSVIRMDPDCAICHAPASLQCDCEAKGLETAVRQAESRVMQSLYSEIRAWVRGHAQDYILEFFRQLTERRKAAHANHLERLTAHAYHYYHSPPHPNEIAQAQAALKRGIDEDWQSSVQRYPEVLEYFYGLVDLNVPQDDDPAVSNPPLGPSAAGTRKPNRRSVQGALANESFEREPRSSRHAPLPSRTPPPPMLSRRTPGPPMPHMGGMASVPPPNRRMFQPPPSTYFDYN
ncbi:hypothetical protein PG990_009495 [Apiospora arundinis]